MQIQAMVAGFFLEALTESAVGGNPADHGDLLHAIGGGSLQGLGDQDFDDRFLETGHQVFEAIGTGFPHPSGRSEAPEEIRHRGLDAAEAEFQGSVIEKGPWELNSLRVAVSGETVDNHTAGISQVEQFGDLVEGLAGSIVAGGTEQLMLSVRGNQVKRRMAT